MKRRKCDSCYYHTVYYDDFGEDGCVCHNPNANYYVSKKGKIIDFHADICSLKISNYCPFYIKSNIK